MKKQIAILTLMGALLALNVKGQDYQARLLKDMVKTTAGKMTVDDFTLITLSNGNTLQIKSHGEAPAAGVISRDNFVALFSQLVAQNNEEITKADEGATTKDLDEIIGNPDVIINIFVAKTGIQMEVKHGEEVNRTTFKWEELFK